MNGSHENNNHSERKRSETSADRFRNDLVQTITRYRMEESITYAEAVGVLSLVTAAVTMEALGHEP